MSDIVTLEDRPNALLRRREVRCLFRGKAGKLSRNDAVSLVTQQLKLDKKFVIPVTLKCETGKADVKGIFYVYEDEGLAKKHLPKYVFLRLLSKEERKKVAETEKAKAKKPEAAPKKPKEAAPKEKKEAKEEKKEPDKAKEAPKEKAKPEAKAKEKPAEAEEAKA